MKRLLALFVSSVLINIIPLFFFKEKAAISTYSVPAVAIMLLVIIKGISAYLLRHKGNLLLLGRPRHIFLFSSDKAYAFTQEYTNEFNWMFLVYCTAIPFYIPCIFFVSKWVHTLWTLCVLSAPQIIYFIYGISKTVRHVKAYKATQQKQAQELKAQQQREELGHFK